MSETPDLPWIPVTERLPTPDDMPIIAYERGLDSDEFTAPPWYTAALPYILHRIERGGVTHFMPFQPPASTGAVTFIDPRSGVIRSFPSADASPAAPDKTTDASLAQPLLDRLALADQALLVLDALMRRVVRGESVVFGCDECLGPATVPDAAGAHTHVGTDGAGVDEQKALAGFVDDLHRVLVQGDGFPWVKSGSGVHAHKHEGN